MPSLLLCVGVWVFVILSIVANGFGVLVVLAVVQGDFDRGGGGDMGRIERSQRVLSIIV